MRSKIALNKGSKNLVHGLSRHSGLRMKFFSQKDPILDATINTTYEIRGSFSFSEGSDLSRPKKLTMQRYFFIDLNSP